MTTHKLTTRHVVVVGREAASSKSDGGLNAVFRTLAAPGGWGSHAYGSVTRHVVRAGCIGEMTQALDEINEGQWHPLSRLVLVGHGKAGWVRLGHGSPSSNTCSCSGAKKCGRSILKLGHKTLEVTRTALSGQFTSDAELDLIGCRIATVGGLGASTDGELLMLALTRNLGVRVRSCKASPSLAPDALCRAPWKSLFEHGVFPLDWLTESMLDVELIRPARGGLGTPVTNPVLGHPHVIKITG